MEEKTKAEVLEILKKADMTFNSKRKVVSSGDTMSDANADKVLKQYGITTEEARKVVFSKEKKTGVEIPDDFRCVKRLQDVQMVTSVTSDIKWNKKDEELFNFFSLARATDDPGSGMVLLVTNHAGEYIAIPLGGSNLSLLADITSACTALKYTDENGVVRTIYDHVTRAYDQMMHDAVTAYKTVQSIEDFSTWVRTGLPSMMMNNYEFRATIETRDVEVEEGHKETMTKCHSLYFKEGSPFHCLAAHYDTLAGVPSKITKLPKLFSNDPDEPALFHIDLDQILDHETGHPTWDRYMQRYTPGEGKVFKAFVWSIFDAKNTGRQMLYIYDPDGFSGKSVVANAIASALGTNLVTAVQKDSLSNQFAFSKVWKSRLVIVGDNKNPYLVKSEKMHMILGSDYAEVEPKGKSSFSVKLQAKVMANGNTKLKIDPDATHESTRVIIIEPKMTDDILKEIAVLDEDGNIKRYSNGKPQLIGDASFGERLEKEFRSFLVDCKAAYEELCPTRSSIILPEEMLASIEYLSEDTVDSIDDKAEELFDFDPKYYMTVNSFRETIDQLIGDLRSFTSKDDANLTYDSIKQHLEKKYHIRKSSKRIDKVKTKVYYGLCNKGDAQSLPDLNEPEDVLLSM